MKENVSGCFFLNTVYIIVYWSAFVLSAMKVHISCIIYGNEKRQYFTRIWVTYLLTASRLWAIITTNTQLKYKNIPLEGTIE